MAWTANTVVAAQFECCLAKNDSGMFILLMTQEQKAPVGKKSPTFHSLHRFILPVPKTAVSYTPHYESCEMTQGY